MAQTSNKKGKGETVFFFFTFVFSLRAGKLLITDIALNQKSIFIYDKESLVVALATGECLEWKQPNANVCKFEMKYLNSAKNCFSCFKLSTCLNLSLALVAIYLSPCALLNFGCFCCFFEMKKRITSSRADYNLLKLKLFHSPHSFNVLIITEKWNRTTRSRLEWKKKIYFIRLWDLICAHYSRISLVKLIFNLILRVACYEFIIGELEASPCCRLLYGGAIKGY